MSEIINCTIHVDGLTGPMGSVPHHNYVNTAAGHRGPAQVGHGALKANGGKSIQGAGTQEWEAAARWKRLFYRQIRHSCDLRGHEAPRGQTEQTLREPNAGSQVTPSSPSGVKGHGSESHHDASAGQGQDEWRQVVLSQCVYLKYADEVFVVPCPSLDAHSFGFRSIMA
ncbi:unnamed protein product [Pleuronectes platessa]|uniref:Uncharacterized protein n=1 Tax=Pleuronectes platessa TaxID=8262 RepID=A0A9N7Z8D3_PLEPL|nr:unnamed protein product [Pleuronectes platessa]